MVIACLASSWVLLQGSTLNPVDYLAIGYFITSLLSVPSSDTSNVLLEIRKIVDKHRLKLLLLELSKYPIGEACERRLEITVLLKNIDIFSHQIFEGFQHNSAVVHLNLSCTGLVATEDTAQALTTLLRINKTIKHLDLSMNWFFSDSGAYCVCQGLKHNTTLVYLNLSYTGITDEGAEYIAQALKFNCSLQTLNISKNGITNNGFACIETSLKTNTMHLRLNK